jgi:hypothetical protein
MIDSLQRSLVSSGDPTTMTRDQISAEIVTLVARDVAGGISDADRNRSTSLVAAQSGVTQEEAARRVTQMDNTVKADLAQAEQKARAAADTLARGAAIAARALFASLALGLLAALVGAWIGTRHKRVLHPMAEPGHDAYDAGYDRQFAGHSARPESLSNYDDAGQMVSQYLQGVNFPLSKQDLLQQARSGNVRPGVLQTFERLAEGNYASANQVVRTLGMAH